jgi:hypothetical protein
MGPEGLALGSDSPAGHAALGACGVALVSGAYAGALLALRPGVPASADSHYHFSVGREIAHGTWVPNVAHGLPLTVLRDMPVDHYWGYHVLLAPFGLIADPEWGMGIATAVLFAGVCVSMYLFLRARGVAYAWIWALAPMLLSTQDWRFLQLRGGQIIVPLLFGLAQVAFFEPRAGRRRWLLLAIGYVAMLSYHGGLVLLAFHLGGVAALAALRPSASRGRLVDPAVTAAGLALGLTVNPYMDARASTWRFAALHIGDMGRDSAHLYDDQEIAEFHGFPIRVLASHPEWALLLAAVVTAAAMVAWRARSNRASVDTDAIALAGMALAGIVLTAQAIRTREYSVPIAFAFLAVLAPRRAPTGLMTGLASLLLAAALVTHGRATLSLLGALPTRQYQGTRALLEANGDHPILNVAEADYCMLRWQYDRVVCVQGLSRYFIYPYRELFHDVWEIHDRADTSSETPAILRRFWDRGVRLVAAHSAHNKMFQFAETHPDLLRRVFRSDINGASIYAIDRDALDRYLAR